MADNNTPMGPLGPRGSARQQAAPLETSVVPPQTVQPPGAFSTEVVPQPLAQQPTSSGEIPMGPLGPPMPPEEQVLSADTQRRDQQSGLPTAAPGWYEDPIMAARAMLDGMVYGFSDEIGAGVAAAVATIAQPGLAEGAPRKPFRAIYNDMMSHLQDERNIYTANHPGASLGLEVVGSLISPANKPISIVAGKLKNAVLTGSDKLGSLTGLYATRTQQALANMEARATTSPGLATTLARAPQAVSPFKSGVTATVEAVPTMAAAGGLYAIGKREPEQAPMDMAQLGRIATAGGQGAAMTAAFSPLAALFPVIGSALTKNSVVQSLGKGKDFVPLTLAAGENNPALGWVYRSLVGRAFWGAGTMDNQAARWYTPLFTKIDNFSKNLAQTKAVTVALASRVAASAKEEGRRLEQVIRQSSAGRTRSIRADYATALAAIKRDAATAEVVTTAIPAAFRSQVAQAAVPDSFPVVVKQTILSLMEQGKYLEANKALREAWNQHGFSMLNNGTFQIGKEVVTTTTTAGKPLLLGGRTAPTTTTTKEMSIAEVVGKVEKALDETDLQELAQEGGRLENVRKEVGNYLTALMDDKGQIKGSALATLRTKISGMVSNQYAPGSGGTDPLMRTVWLELKSVIDDIVEEQLSPADLAKFLEHKAAYRSKLAVDTAISSAFKEQGAFSPTDWLTSVGKLFKKDVGVNKAPFQQEAYNAQASVANAEATLVSASQQAQSVAAQQTLQALQRREDELAAEVARRTKELKAVVDAVPKNAATEMFRATRSGAVAAQSEITALEDQLAGVRTTRDNLTNLLPRQGNTAKMTAAEAWLPSIILSSLMSGILFQVAGPGGALVGPALGAGVSRVLAAPWFQRGLAGQAGWQQFLQKVINENKTIATATEAGSVGTTAAAASSMDEGIKGTIAKMGKSQRVAAYRAMQANGSFDKFKQANPMSAKLLEEAAK